MGMKLGAVSQKLYFKNAWSVCDYDETKFLELHTFLWDIPGKWLSEW